MLYCEGCGFGGREEVVGWFWGRGGGEVGGGGLSFDVEEDGGRGI